MKRTIVSNIIIIFILVCTMLVCGSGAYVGAFNITTQPIYRGNVHSNKVSLMVNVYWGNEYIPQMLEIFNKYNIKTTFFVGGSWVSKNDELFKTIVGFGHEIANHGFYHKDGGKFDYKTNYDEINANHQLIKTMYGIDMKLFAPPSGSYNSSTLQACEKLGYQAIMWTYDTIDWRDQDADLIYRRATKNMSGGNLILMHPTKATVESLDKIINEYTANNFILTTVSDTIHNIT